MLYNDSGKVESEKDNKIDNEMDNEMDNEKDNKMDNEQDIRLKTEVGDGEDNILDSDVAGDKSTESQELKGLDENPDKFPCDYCSASFVAKNLLKRHFRKEHGRKQGQQSQPDERYVYTSRFPNAFSALRCVIEVLTLV